MVILIPVYLSHQQIHLHKCLYRFPQCDSVSCSMLTPNSSTASFETSGQSSAKSPISFTLH
jgi:hypothetical protein